MQRALITTLVCLATACGAPTKSASDVAAIFDGAGRTLQDKETDLCNVLAARDQPPSTKTLAIDMAGCQNAGLAALNYKSATAFAFLAPSGTPPAPAPASQVQGQGSNAVIHTSLRTQIWLNKTLLDLATAVSSLLKKQQASGNNTGVITIPSASSSAFAGFVTPTITVVEPPKLDPATFSFSMKINIKITGAIVADHDIQVNGQLFNNMFAVTIETTADRTFQQSILKNFQVVLLLIPHAEDVYVDAFVDFNINDFGLESLIKSQVNSFLSTGLKSAVDKATQLGGP